MNMIMTPEERSEITRIVRLPLLKKASFAWGLRNDRRVNTAMTLPLALAAAFIILPVHVLPRWLPFRRRIENVIALSAGLFCFVKLAPPGLITDHLDETEPRE
jgi:hypothetical protein